MPEQLLESASDRSRYFSLYRSDSAFAAKQRNGHRRSDIEHGGGYHRLRCILSCQKADKKSVTNSSFIDDNKSQFVEEGESV